MSNVQCPQESQYHGIQLCRHCMPVEGDVHDHNFVELSTEKISRAANQILIIKPHNVAPLVFIGCLFFILFQLHASLDNVFPPFYHESMCHHNLFYVLYYAFNISSSQGSEIYISNNFYLELQLFCCNHSVSFIDVLCAGLVDLPNLR